MPLHPEGYRFKADFPEAALLVKEADVRMAGVNIGKVKDKELAPDGRADDSRDRAGPPLRPDRPGRPRGPAPEEPPRRDLRGDRRPGSPRAKNLPDGGTLPARSVDQTVQLDEVFRVFDPRDAAGLPGVAPRGGDRHLRHVRRDFNDSLGNAAPFFKGGADVLRPLAEQEVALRRVSATPGACSAPSRARTTACAA